MPGKEQVIINTSDVRVRKIELGPTEQGQWHYHSKVTDNFFCLTGSVVVCMKGQDEEILLSPGQGFEVAPGRVHRVANREAESSTYLLIQGVGTYDFIPVDQ